MPVNRRINPFSGEENPLAITGEAHTVPASSPYWVYLDEIPLEEDPASVTVRAAPTSTDLQPDGTAGKDSYVYEDTPAVNQGSAAILVTGREGGPTYGRYRGLVEFDLSSLPAGSVTDARLRLYMEAGGGGYPSGNQVGAHEITSSWTEGAVTYADQPTHNPVAEDTVTAYSAGWYEWNITDLVSAWRAGTKSNYGAMLKHADEISATDTARNWTSSDGTAAQRPVLRVAIAGTTYTVLPAASTPGAGECALSYGYGALNFNSGAANTGIVVDYKGTGSPVKAEDTGGISTLLDPAENADLLVTGTTNLAPGIHSYKNLTVSPGATLGMSAAGTLVLNVSGDCTIEGTIDLDGKGFAGGAGAAVGKAGKDGRGFGGLGGHGGGGAPTSGTPGGGGGGGASTAGTDGSDGTTGAGGAGGEAHPSTGTALWPWQVPLAGGGGGAGGGAAAATGGAGGAGGGALLLQVQGTLRVVSSAVVRARGVAGSSPGGGGGAGGVIWLRASSRQVDATPLVGGGAGDGSGGAGADGWYLVEGL